MFTSSYYQPPIFAPSSAQVQVVTMAAALTNTNPKTYYVSPTGNDDNIGTSPKTAWKSLAKINSLDLNPGDRVLLEGGYTYDGGLYFSDEDMGTSSSPIIVASYGQGRATINAGSNGAAIFAYNAAGYRIDNLNIIGSGVSSNPKAGIDFYTDLPGDVKLNGIAINKVEVSGFGDYGIKIGGWNQRTGFTNIVVTNVSTYDNGKAGLLTYAEVPNVHENIYVGNVKAYNNFGVPGTGSGSGIVLGGVNGGTIERSVAYNNGGLGNSGSGGPVGIWAYDSTRILIQHNESSNNRTGNQYDGGGFDFDHNVSNSIMQYNYSHGNDGAGYLLAHAPNDYGHNGNIIRYNISHNDARKNSYAAILLWGRIANTEIYNNTVLVEPSTTGSPSAIAIINSGIEKQDVSSVHIRNNILQTTGGLELVKIAPTQLDGAQGLLFQGNNYYATRENFKILWGGKTYNSLEGWSSATGQEKLEGISVGFNFAPLWANNIREPIFINNPDALTSLDAYRLSSSSPLIDRGLNLRSLFDHHPGLRDFNGIPLPQGAGYDLGAVESF